MVGSNKFSTFGAQGTVDYMTLKHFSNLTRVRDYLKNECECTILGIEIVDGAEAIQDHPFRGNTAFILGNEGQGLSEQQMRICDGFVYIPQNGKGTASLNVTVAGSIVLHHFSLWAKYAESERDGYKYVLGERPRRTTKRGVCVDPEQVKREREERRANGSESWLESDAQEGSTGASGTNAVFADMFTE